MADLENRDLRRVRLSRAFFLAAVLCASVLNPLNSSTISVALPVLLRHFHAGPGDLVWLISAYYFGSALAQPVFGKLGDQFGYRIFVYLGLAILVAPTVLAPFAPSFGWLIAWRAVQAIGTSMLFPSAIGLVRQHHDRELGRILGWIGTSVGVALALGPPLAGGVLALVGWRGIFWLNAPLIAAVAVFLRLGLRDTPASRAPVRQGVLTAVDLPGIVLLAASLGLLLAASAIPGDPASLWLLLAGALLVSILWTVELRAVAPAFDVRLLRRPAFAVAGAVTVLVNFVMYLVLYGLPSLLEAGRGLTPLASGFFLLGFAGVLAAVSPLAGRLAQGTRRRGPLLLAGALLVLGSLSLTQTLVMPLGLVFIPLALIGVSFALSNVLLQKLALESAPATDAGSASGLYTLLRYVGTMGSSVAIAAALPQGRAAALVLFSLAAFAALLSTAIAAAVRDAARL